MGYEDLKPYPLYQLGVLDQLFAAIAPEWRDKLIERITVRGVKASRTPARRPPES